MSPTLVCVPVRAMFLNMSNFIAFNFRCNKITSYFLPCKDFAGNFLSVTGLIIPASASKSAAASVGVKFRAFIVEIEIFDIHFQYRQ